MKKSSLGRRSATGIPRMGSLDNTRKSGIPIKVTSTDQSLAHSNYRASKGSVSATPKTPHNFNQNLPTGSARPYRSTTVSSDSTRLSSFGGNKGGKKDLRPLHDKEWQAHVEKRIYNYFYEEGPGILPNANIKQLSLNLFVDVVNVLFKKLDESCDINKDNFKQELPFLLKKVQYLGKVDKSLLSTVNAPHSWPYALGILHFLLEAVESINSIDAEALLFPDSFLTDAKDEECLWDRKKIIPYYIKAHQLHLLGSPDAMEQMAKLDEEIINEHFSEDLFESLDCYQRANELLSEEVTGLENENAKLKENAMSCEKMTTTLANDLRKEQEYIVQLHGYIKNLEDKNKGSQLDIECLEETLLKRKAKKEKMKEELSAQAVSHNDMEKRKEKRDLLIRDIESENQLIEEYSNLVYAEDMKIFSLKNQLGSLVKEYNTMIANMMEIEPNVEKIKFDGVAHDVKIDEIATSFDQVFKNSKETFEQLNDNLGKEAKQCGEVKIQVENELREIHKVIEEEKLQVERLDKEINKLSEEHEMKTQNLHSELVGLVEKCKILDDSFDNESKNLSELENLLSKGYKKLKEMGNEKEEFERRAVAYLEVCRAAIIKEKKLFL